MRNWNRVVVILVAWQALQATGAESERIEFARDVRPILERSCWKCHGPEKQNGGLRFDNRKDALQAGDSGKKAVTPGVIHDSELIRRVESTDADEQMPQKSKPLSSQEIKILRAWIEQGAIWPESAETASSGRREMVVTVEDRQHWSFRALHAVDLPAVQDWAWCQTTVDRFILFALESKGIRPNPPANRQTLIRRVYLDVIGLPPSPDEVAAFVADSSPTAYEELIERLLASPHYGERWGRHWLDVARYADSGGMETDADRPHAYHYRDFVIRGLNDDLSYQTFVRWQLAGDEYEPDNPQALSATGFLTAAPNENLTDQHLEEERLRLRFNELDDMAATTASAFLSLTLACARCHDHKFDAIPTRDYYRLQCAFKTTARDDVFLATRAEIARYRDLETLWNQRLQAAQSRLKDWLTEQKKPHTNSLRNGKIDALSISSEQKKLLKEQEDSEAAKKIENQHKKQLQLSDEDYRRVFTEEQRRQWDVLQTDFVAVQRSQPQRPPMALAITDSKAEPEPTWLLNRGDFYSKAEPVQLGFLTVLTGSQSPADYWATARREGPIDRSTGQRRAMADWITDVEQGAGPLLARVIVNRVWQHHFGEGLVRTVSDFGVRGDRPTHPELLEWLTHEFVTGGWRLKSLHRLLLTSSVYRQDTAFDAARSRLDPDNYFLWRRRPQRLEAEILRDVVLSVSGTLNPEPFGPSFKPPIPPEAMLARNTKDPYPKDARDIPATRRRTVYMFHKRVVPYPILQAFDGPNAAVSCGRRMNTTVAPQALALLNDTFFRDRATDFARRLLAESGNKPEDWVLSGYRLALSRPPNDIERAASLEFLDRQLRRRAERQDSASPEESRLQALTDYCQTLFSLNEFIYVE